jgi:hypothetical protein
MAANRSKKQPARGITSSPGASFAKVRKPVARKPLSATPVGRVDEAQGENMLEKITKRSVHAGRLALVVAVLGGLFAVLAALPEALLRTAHTLDFVMAVGHRFPRTMRILLIMMLVIAVVLFSYVQWYIYMLDHGRILTNRSRW